MQHCASHQPYGREQGSTPALSDDLESVGVAEHRRGDRGGRKMIGRTMDIVDRLAAPDSNGHRTISSRGEIKAASFWCSVCRVDEHRQPASAGRPLRGL
jgi:hypothetical protein